MQDNNKSSLQEKAVERLKKTNNNEYSFIGEYINSYTKVFVRHNCETCNYFTWETIPKNTFMKKKLTCPKCSGINAFLNRDTFLTKDKIEKLLGTTYSIIGEIPGKRDSAIRLRHNCETCKDSFFYASPNRIKKILLNNEILCPICKSGRASTKKPKGRYKEPCKEDII